MVPGNIVLRLDSGLKGRSRNGRVCVGDKVRNDWKFLNHLSNAGFPTLLIFARQGNDDEFLREGVDSDQEIEFSPVADSPLFKEFANVHLQGWEGFF